MKAIDAVNTPIAPETRDRIAELIGAEKCVMDGDVLVVKPATTEDLSKTVITVMAAKGSLSPMIHKGTKHCGQVLVDMSDMASIICIDKVHMTVKVQAGCKISDIVDALAAEGLTLGAIPAGVDATVDSFIYAEEALIGSYKYGTVKDLVYNIVAVGAQGDVITTGYDNIGYYMSAYNMIQTLAASNGKLALATEVTFKVHPAGVTKAAIYKFGDVAAIQTLAQKIAQEASLKPLHISYNVNDKAVLAAFQGNEEFVDVDVEALDAIAAELGAEKVDAAAAAERWAGIRGEYCVSPTAATVYLPLKNLAAYLEALPAGFSVVAGNVPDRSTAVVKLHGDAGEDAFNAAVAKAEELGGRSSCKCATAYLDEPTAAFAKKVEDAYLGAEVEEPKLKREVTPELIEKIKAIVGANNVSTNGMDKILYSHDMAPLPKMAGLAFNNIPDVIVRPENVRQVAAVVALAYKAGVAVLPRGNASWGLGGCMPTSGGILMDMSSKMNKIIKIDKENLCVRCEAGITWKALLDACEEEGYLIGSMPSSFPSGTIGAWISTNGMGIGSYKYGSAKDNILNSQIVVDDGSIVTTGYDDMGSYRAPYNLNQFFAGAEGTLGIVGEVTFRIYPAGKLKCLGYEFDELKDAHQPIQDMVADASVRPLHVAWSDSLHFENQRRAGCHAPDVKNLLLVTLQGDDKHNDLEEAFFDAVAEKAGGRKISYEIAEHEWSERCYEFRARKLGVGEIPAEVIVPTVNWGEFTDRCYEGFKEMKMEAGGVIGVMVDRSTVLFMPYYFKDDEMITGMLSFGFNFYLGDVAAEYGGRSTGFGVFFAWMLDVIHDADTASRMRYIKTVLDSHDIISPGHVTTGMTRFGISMSKPLMSMGSFLMQFMKKIMPADRTFKYNLERFRYNDLEHMKTLDRVHTLGDGTQ